ncbi:M48 family metallopeptidase [Sulfurospirillum barnesii]|uniref:Putative metal-dependent hydrolase n=1 Tax=Sulfurospirillum barnesii (strain ATCC 700032 / DSM 10660 / SES-3) TaxID=760154 RepID=I3XVF6_SULBS|nr:SprT family zinc-dependent metalloprotease [Sulfurospirillum barnesii]AFL67930.1 putative metal-dependent hydrolase [Sulfurospirillum barnesii SES-3]
MRASLTKSKVGLIKHLEYEGETLSYSIVTNKRLKHLYIHIDPKKGVIVKTPYTSHEYLERIVHQKASWIFKKFKALQERTSVPQLFEDEGKVLYLGEAIGLHVNQTPEAFYKEKTIPLVRRLVEEWSFIMGVKPAKISFRKAKKRWGSCSHINELSFNLSLAQLPLECITYIVIHELSHITHKHHQKSFWNCVGEFMPEYKACERTLKAFSPSL